MVNESRNCVTPERIQQLINAIGKLEALNLIFEVYPDCTNDPEDQFNISQFFGNFNEISVQDTQNPNPVPH